jgi:pimeloyl-ACP methyl ester carboxylesterase
LITYPAPGKFLTIGTAKMHYLCEGTGEPTLVLEAGFGGGVLDWSPVIHSLAKHHRVCAFDRLGQDWSDTAPHPRTFRTTADDLHAALQQLRIRAPIMVGHSLGGAIVQIYAATYPVQGVVLVDGLTSDVVDAVVHRLGTYESLTPLAQVGLLRPLGSLAVHPGYSPVIREQMIALRSRATALMNVADEGAIAAQSAPAELRAAEIALNTPLLLIAAEQSDVPDLPIGTFAVALKALSERKPNATYALVPQAGHYVHATHTQDVTSIIEQWLSSIQ